MRTLAKWLGGTVLVLLLGALLVLGAAWYHSERALSRVYVIEDAALEVSHDAAAVAAGRHLFDTRGCGDCHDALGQGRLVFEAAPLIRVVAPNITPARLSARGYDADAIAAAVRHGVRADGTALRVMPSIDWSELSDADMSALIAYMQTLPASEHDPGETEVRMLARVLHLFGRFPLLHAERIDHTPRARGAPAAAISVAFGAYVAQTCSGCHGADFGGGPPLGPDLPPVADLTPAGLRGWTEADFLRAMREGRRPDGRMLQPIMPWPAFSKMTDTELRAIWVFLQQLPPRA